MTFQFQKFKVKHSESPMKVGTDAVLLGCLAELCGDDKVLDVGTGCGVVSLIIAQRFQTAQILGIDIDVHAINEAKENFGNSPWSSRLQSNHCSLQDFIRGTDLCFDHIVSNPPFFAGDKLSVYPSRTKSRHTVYLSHEEFLEGVAAVSNQGTKLTVIIPSMLYDHFTNISEMNGFYPTKAIGIRPKPNKSFNRHVIQFRRVNGYPVEKSLIIYNEDGSYSDSYKELTRDFLNL